ncbi:lactadherin-like [Diadema antillarum]|uniref:lactadherin-like n=1 Tax=Diadema antillarum TaxID=105358 RepID=UPI003A8C5157
MRECVERTDFVCRQVFISFQWKQCVFAEVGEYYEGDLVNGYTLTHSDLFVRKSTHCDGFLPDFENNNKWAASKCVFPLGMEAGWIGDDDIVASSFLDEDHAPHNARLYGNSSWIPDPKEETPYIKVSFPERMVLVGLLLQDGRHHDSLYTLQFQLAFRLMGYDIPKLYSVQGRREPKNFTVNMDPSCVTFVEFPTPIWTTELQLFPSTSGNESIALRLEFLGCKDNECDSRLGVGGNQILNDQMTSSSYVDMEHHPAYAGFNPFRRGGDGWMPRRKDLDPWWKLTVRSDHKIMGIITRKCFDQNGRQGWMDRFDLSWTPLGNTTLNRLNNL